MSPDPAGCGHPALRTRLEHFHRGDEWCIDASLFHCLGQLDDAAGAQAVCAQGEELRGVLQGADAAGGLDLHMGGHMGLEQRHVVESGSGGGEAGGGLDIVGAGLADDLAHPDLFRLGQLAGLDDDLENPAAAGVLDGPNLGQQLLPALVLDPAQVDDHVDLVGPVFDCVRRLEAFGGCGGVAVGEADDRADGQLPVRIGCGGLHIAGRNTGRGRAEADAECKTCCIMTMYTSHRRHRNVYGIAITR